MSRFAKAAAAAAAAVAAVVESAVFACITAVVDSVAPCATAGVAMQLRRRPPGETSAETKAKVQEYKAKLHKYRCD